MIQYFGSPLSRLTLDPYYSLQHTSFLARELPIGRRFLLFRNESLKCHTCLLKYEMGFHTRYFTGPLFLALRGGVRPLSRHFANSHHMNSSHYNIF